MKKILRAHPYLTLAIFTMVLYLFANQFLAVTDTAESNYALTAKEMVLSGDWISPQIYGKYWYDKPIFYYWELALSFALFGFNEMAARLPAAILGSFSVLFTFWFSRKVYGEKVGWLSALILGTSAECWILSKAIITDTTLFLFMSAAMVFFYLGYTEDRKYYFLCYVFAALATLTKGPIGIILPGLSGLLFLLYKKDLKEMAHVHLFSGLAIFFILTGAWYGTMCYLHGSDFILNFIGVHNILRATVPEHPAHNTWYFYILVFLAGFFPWSLFAPVSFFKRWKRNEIDLRSSSECAQLLVIYGAIVLIFFQLAATKYTTYTFPALFPLSILTAVMYKDISPRIEKSALAMGALYCILALSLAPTIMMGRSGKEAGLALAHMDTEGKIIASVGQYRTSTVFYSGKTIYRAEDADRIDHLKPGHLDWNAKNVMPFIAKEELENNPNVILITKDNDHSDFVVAYKNAEKPVRINIPGHYELLLR